MKFTTRITLAVAVLISVSAFVLIYTDDGDATPRDNGAGPSIVDAHDGPDGLVVVLDEPVRGTVGVSIGLFSKQIELDGERDFTVDCRLSEGDSRLTLTGAVNDFIVLKTADGCTVAPKYAITWVYNSEDVIVEAVPEGHIPQPPKALSGDTWQWNAQVVPAIQNAIYGAYQGSEPMDCKVVRVVQEEAGDWKYVNITFDRFFKDEAFEVLVFNEAGLKVTEFQCPLKNTDTVRGLWIDGDLNPLPDGDYSFVVYKSQAVGLPIRMSVPGGSIEVVFNMNGHGQDRCRFLSEPGRIAAPDTSDVEGYTLVGWYKDAALTLQWNFTDDSVKESMTLYSKWERQSYDLTFKDGDRVVRGTVKIPFGERIDFPEVRSEGREFLGWYDGDARMEDDAVMPGHDVMATARWGDVPAGHSITYMVDGQIYAKQDYRVGDRIALPAPPSGADGRNFEGWFHDGIQLKNGEAMPSRDLVCEARWSNSPEPPEGMVRLSFVDMNGMPLKDVHGRTINNIYAVPGSTFPSVPEPAGNGMTFESWSPMLPDIVPDADQVYHAVFGKAPDKLVVTVDVADGRFLEIVLFSPTHVPAGELDLTFTYYIVGNVQFWKHVYITVEPAEVTDGPSGSFVHVSIDLMAHPETSKIFDRFRFVETTYKDVYDNIYSNHGMFF